MRIGRPFRLKGIQNDDDLFVPLWTKCRSCGRKFRIVAIEVFASESLYGSRSLHCMKCATYWESVLVHLGMEGRDDKRPVEYVALTMDQLC